MRTIGIFLLLAVVSGTAQLALAAVSPEETQKQNEFKKSYKGLEKEEDLKALAELEGAVDRSTWQLLTTVIQTSNFKDVRIEAFKLLANMPCRDQSLAQLLVQVFNNAKMNDFESRVAYAEHMRNCEFKYLICETLVEYGSKLRYPELITGYRRDNTAGYSGGNGTLGGDPNFGIKKQREEFEKFVEAFNKTTKANVAAKDKDSSMAFKRWWAESKVKILREDKELLEKYRQEDMAAANKNNPLLPKTAKKDEGKDEKPEEKKDAKDEKKS
ncbi:MAG TPA: hypothetical protein VEK08_01400 [Planctomycetota bacterium]|nr:hypothetical protein [Planctomycetota bacterium]